MSTDLTDFATWLRATAAAAGFDPDVRGGLTSLAKAAGVDPSPVSRAMSGDMIPQISTQRALAIAMGIEPLEMYVRSGTINAEDIPDANRPPTTRPSPTDLRTIADKWGVPPEKRDMLFGVVEAVAKEFAEQRDSDPTGK